jgi:L-iditol 2-dehydrogenase
MKALLAQGQTVTVEELPIPRLEGGDLLLKVNACGICVSDLHKLRFRSLLKSTVLGHEIAGEVVQAGENLQKFHTGDRVVLAHHVPCQRCHYCRHGNYSMCPQFRETALDPGGFSEYVRVPALHVQHVTFPIPSNLSDREACFMEPLACCLRDIKRVKVQEGDTVVIVGLGSIGILIGQLVRLFGGQCFGIDLDAMRCRFANASGFLGTAAGFTSDLKSQLMAVTDNRGADVVVVTAGHPSIISEAMTWLRDGGTLNSFASFHPESRLALDWNDLYYREINVVSSYSPSPADLAEALDLLARGKIDVSRLAGDPYPLSRFSEALDLLEKRQILKAIMAPHAAG